MDKKGERGRGRRGQGFGTPRPAAAASPGPGGDTVAVAMAGSVLANATVVLRPGVGEPPARGHASHSRLVFSALKGQTYFKGITSAVFSTLAQRNIKGHA